MTWRRDTLVANSKRDCPPSRLVPPYHELINAAMYAYRNYRDEKLFEQAVRYLAEGVAEDCWTGAAKRSVEHYHRYGNRELIGNSVQIKTLRERINRAGRRRSRSMCGSLRRPI